MKKRVILILSFVLLFLFCSCNGRYNDTSSNSSENSSSLETFENTNESSITEETNELFEVSYEQVKSTLCGAYSNMGSIYVYDLIFFENGDFIFIDPYSKKYTSEDSIVRYYLVQGEHGDAVQVSALREDGRKFEFIVYEKSTEITDEYPIPSIKSNTRLSDRLKEHVPQKYFTLGDFKNVKIGETRIYASEFMNEKLFPSEILLSSDGDIVDYPMSDGRHIWVKFDENQVVSSIEISDRLPNVYF